ncbi:hypothetical protein [Tateyamaria sp.]|uniref:hypothetical protein n=1 Tax=Tateyamaria sp. TaxID=1929288 RepID=UPI00329AEED1
MTKTLTQNRGAQACRYMHASLFCMALMGGAGAAQAGTAWDMFVARCLDPFEHLTLAVTEGLQAQPIDQMHEARLVYGPTPEGYLLVLDEAPSVGVRTCAVEFVGKEMTQAELAWRDEQFAKNLYVPDGDWLVSNEWIDPGVMMRTKSTDSHTTYVVVETDLES